MYVHVVCLPHIYCYIHCTGTYTMYTCTWMCGESWLAIKDSLTHRPSSQGWASECPLGLHVFSHIHVYFSHSKINFKVLVSLFVQVGITFLSSLYMLVCYAHVIPCTVYCVHIYVHVHVHVHCIYLSQQCFIHVPNHIRYLEDNIIMRMCIIYTGTHT